MTRLSSFAAQTLQRQIHAGHYATGSALPGQRDLAASLGISRAALREAISTLEALGMVRSQPGKGVFVTAGAGRAANEVPAGPLAMSPQDVFQFRAIVEPAAAALAARNATAAEREALQAIQARMDAALHALDLVGASEADLEFHLAIADFSANPLLSSAIRSLEEPIAYSLRLPFADPGGVWAPADEHQAVLAAICVGDATAAHRAMTYHLRRAATRISLSFIDTSSPTP
ncbi:FadR/GntR family transcriptional regulator [Uliginosibacterium sp. TH139]|uniref:FadR/GntR family transcriptional regulator n=1 Tax=Uliginosibacterium sp. TH139 TaxID=2067453 RepID=UPI000C7A3A48|nr:FCD domain-containing protein [Uliginosibacterium sp. TH139]PLK49070.1 FadR family transcriptional regulator [Uliginosibacterium sp. TH139]